MNKKKPKSLMRIQKIRNLLGNDYHLNVSLDPNFNIDSWVLFKNYKDSAVYFSKENKPIMSSKTKTIDDLETFAKTHHRIDIMSFLINTNEILCLIAMLLLFVNIIFWDNNFVAGIALGLDLAIIVTTLVNGFINLKNDKVNMLEMEESIERAYYANDEMERKHE